MKKRNFIVFSVVLVLLCNFLGVASTGAWFVSGGTFGDNAYESAKVMYLPALESEAIYPDGLAKYGRLVKGAETPVEGEAASPVFITPGENIIDTKDGEIALPQMLSLENFSTVPTNVRVQMNVTFDPTRVGEPNPDPIFTGQNFEWREVAGVANTYWYGVTIAEKGFMPLLEVTFANVADGKTELPLNYKEYYKNNTAGKYSWPFTKATETDTIPYWDLKGDIVDISAVEAGKTQFYNVISAVKLVADVRGTKDQQDIYDTFFSEHFAGHNIKVEILYYAKQVQGMEWDLFTRTLFDAQTPLSRTN